MVVQHRPHTDTSNSSGSNECRNDKVVKSKRGPKSPRDGGNEHGRHQHHQDRHHQQQAQLHIHRYNNNNNNHTASSSPEEVRAERNRKSLASSSSENNSSNSMLLLVETIDKARTLAIQEYTTHGSRLVDLQHENATLKVDAATKDATIQQLRDEITALQAAKSRIIDQTQNFFDEGLFNCGSSCHG